MERIEKESRKSGFWRGQGEEEKRWSMVVHLARKCAVRAYAEIHILSTIPPSPVGTLHTRKRVTPCCVGMCRSQCASDAAGVLGIWLLMCHVNG